MDQRAGTLHITDLTADDSGSYYCVANTTGQQLVTSNGAFLRVRSKLQFFYSLKNGIFLHWVAF